MAARAVGPGQESHAGCCAILSMQKPPELIPLVLMAGLAPVWLLAGLADYTCHRLQHIERNAGVRESALHVLMLAELGVGIFVALFLVPH